MREIFGERHSHFSGCALQKRWAGHFSRLGQPMVWGLWCSAPLPWSFICHTRQPRTHAVTGLYLFLWSLWSLWSRKRWIFQAALAGCEKIITHNHTITHRHPLISKTSFELHAPQTPQKRLNPFAGEGFSLWSYAVCNSTLWSYGALSRRKDPAEPPVPHPPSCGATCNGVRAPCASGYRGTNQRSSRAPVC